MMRTTRPQFFFAENDDDTHTEDTMNRSLIDAAVSFQPPPPRRASLSKESQPARTSASTVASNNVAGGRAQSSGESSVAAKVTTTSRSSPTNVWQTYSPRRSEQSTRAGQHARRRSYRGGAQQRPSSGESQPQRGQRFWPFSTLTSSNQGNDSWSSSPGTRPKRLSKSSKANTSTGRFSSLFTCCMGSGLADDHTTLYRGSSFEHLPGTVGNRRSSLEFSPMGRKGSFQRTRGSSYDESLLNRARRDSMPSRMRRQSFDGSMLVERPRRRSRSVEKKDSRGFLDRACENAIAINYSDVEEVRSDDESKTTLITIS